MLSKTTEICYMIFMAAVIDSSKPAHILETNVHVVCTLANKDAVNLKCDRQYFFFLVAYAMSVFYLYGRSKVIREYNKTYDTVFF